MHKLSECDPLWVQKKKNSNKISYTYLATVQTTQHRDSSVNSVTLGIFSKSYVTYSVIFFFNWDSLHAMLNYEAWSYKNGSTKKITGYRKSV